jgi:hypothetical protein
MSRPAHPGLIDNARLRTIYLTGTRLFLIVSLSMIAEDKPSDLRKVDPNPQESTSPPSPEIKKPPQR